MITYSKKGCRHTFGMNTEDLESISEVIWLLNHTPKEVGYNRKPFTFKQRQKIEEFGDRINYPDHFAELLNKKYGQ